MAILKPPASAYKADTHQRAPEPTIRYVQQATIAFATGVSVMDYLIPGLIFVGLLALWIFALPKLKGGG